MSHPNTLTTEKVQHLSGHALGLLAETLVFYIDTMDVVPDSGLYGDVHESLHVIALEMNRRHGHAFEQSRYDVANALDTICHAQYDDGMDVTTVQLARAYGVLVDQGSEGDWNGVEHFDYTPQRVLDILHGMALDEAMDRKLQEMPDWSPAMAVAPF